MAKPTYKMPTWAESTVYTVGPKVGNDTKVPEGGEASLAMEGHVPGRSNPTAANAYNRWLNAVGEHARWVADGSPFADADAHIVETDSNGYARIAKAFVGSELVTSPSLTVTKATSLGGTCLKILANDYTGIEIDSNNTSGVGVVSIDVRNNTTGVTSHMQVLDTDGGVDSLGGIRCEVETDRVIAAGASKHLELAAGNFYNGQGVALEARCDTTDATLAAVIARNTADGGVSLRAGYGDDASPEENFGGVAIKAGGGNSDNSTIKGGDAIEALGGAGATGYVAGHGIRAIAGLGGDTLGAAGVLAEAVDDYSHAIIARHDPFDIGNSTAVVVVETFTNSAPGITVESQGFGAGVSIEAQGSAGLRVEMTQEGGGNIGPALDLEPQDPSTLSQAGYMWTEEDGSICDYRVVPAASVRHSLIHSNESPCYARSAYQTLLSITAGGTTNVDTFSFLTGNRPRTAGDVLIKAHVVARWNASETQVMNMIVRDMTAGGTPIAVSQVFASVNPGGGGVEPQVSTSFCIPYTLPAAGARTFRWEIDHQTGATPIEVSGLVEVHEARQ